MIDEFPDFENSIPDESTGCCGNPLRGCMDCPPRKKLTFEEWAVSYGYGYWVAPGVFGWNSLYFNENDVRDIWVAAQENV
jgi:hypothetical protein